VDSGEYENEETVTTECWKSAFWFVKSQNVSDTFSNPDSETSKIYWDLLSILVLKYHRVKMLDLYRDWHGKSDLCKESVPSFFNLIVPKKFM
jgi:hypothetical protein